jgi:hypothetical protein
VAPGENKERERERGRERKLLVRKRMSCRLLVSYEATESLLLTIPSNLPTPLAYWGTGS